MPVYEAVGHNALVVNDGLVMDLNMILSTKSDAFRSSNASITRARAETKCPTIHQTAYGSVLCSLTNNLSIVKQQPSTYRP